jgi:two-component system chemotaxis response regulator CheB
LSDKIKVLIVDDSALVRQVLQGILSQDSSIEVVGSAGDPIIAWRKILQLQPDVLTLDLELPRMNGLTFLEQLMADHPLPVVMISSFTESGCETTLRALHLGAIDFITKPRSDVRGQLPDMAQEVIEKIKAAAAARAYTQLLSRVVKSKIGPRDQILRTSENRIGNAKIGSRVSDSGFYPISAPPLVAVGASTGGPEAIRHILPGLSANFPGMVIVQHMPPKFTRAFAESLNNRGPMRVAEAEDGCPVLVGQVLVAPGDFHITVVREGSGFAVRLNQESHVNRHRPSVDVLFQSCAQAARGNAIGLLLTGMGEDGARGLLAMRQAGARTMAQDEATSVVFGMPKAALDLGAADQVLPLGQISGLLRSSVRRSATLVS